MEDVEDPHVYGYATLYKKRTIICKFNGLWPSVVALRDWVNKSWPSYKDIFFFSKGFFIVNFVSDKDCLQVFEQGP